MLDGSAYEVWAVTGIHDIDQKEDIILYPNPWHGEELKVFPENYILQNFETYTIRDITGRMILKGNINSNTIPIQKINYRNRAVIFSNLQVRNIIGFFI